MCWLMLALVLSPALGLVHKVVHASGLPTPAAVHVIANLAQADAPSAEPPQDLLHSLFGAHTKSECVLLDQIGQGHALLAQALPAVQPLPAAIPVVDVSVEPPGQHAAPFRARGPPATLLA